MAMHEGRIVFVSPDYGIHWETPRDHMREPCFDFQTFLIDLARVKLRAGICRESIWSRADTAL